MLLLFFHLPPLLLLLALPLSCSRSSPAVLVEVEAATDGAEPLKQPLYYNYSKSVKTAQKGALWDTRALQRKYLWVGDPPRAAPYEPTLTDTRAEQVRVGEHGRGEEVFLCHQTLWGLNSGQERERERDLSMSSRRKRCKREILKFAQYLFRLITGTLNAGTVHGFSSFSKVFDLGNVWVCS